MHRPASTRPQGSIATARNEQSPQGSISRTAAGCWGTRLTASIDRQAQDARSTSRPMPASSNDVKERWLSTFRGRVGYAQNNWLIYATAGGALANLEHVDHSARGADCGKALALGLAAGAGVEVRAHLGLVGEDRISLRRTAGQVLPQPGTERGFYQQPARQSRRSHPARRRELQAPLERARQLLQALTAATCGFIAHRRPDG